MMTDPEKMKSGCDIISGSMENNPALISFLQGGRCGKGGHLILDLGRMDYSRAFELQKNIVSIKIRERTRGDVLLLLEHPAVFTLGKRGGRENFTVPEKFLETRGVPVIQTGRGGNITFHGPGQLVFYPIIDLERAKIGVADFVTGLEEVMIKTASDFGITARRDKKNHGVWVHNAKIGSIGLSIKRGISFHGLAFNVNLDLEPFSWINPCGMDDISMTSMENELLKSGTTGTCPDMARVKKHLLNHFTSTVYTPIIQKE